MDQADLIRCWLDADSKANHQMHAAYKPEHRHTKEAVQFHYRVFRRELASRIFSTESAQKINITPFITQRVER